MRRYHTSILQSQLSTLLILALSGLWATQATAQSFFEDNVFVHENGQFAVFGTHTFDGANIVETTRTGNRGYFGFGDAASWSSADDASHVDGYVRQYMTTPLVFPIGDNGVYRPVAVSAGPADAAYYAANPNGSFPVATTATGVSDVSTIEYWDIDGAAATSVTLTWDAASDIATITNSNLNALTIAGWDGTQWVAIPSTVDATSLDETTATPVYTGAAGSLTAGSITTDATITPNTYEAYTFARSETDVCLAATVFLQGASILSTTSGIMTDDLRSNNLIPTAEPYASLSGFTHVGNGGGETTTASVLAAQTNTDDNIVD